MGPAKLGGKPRLHPARSVRRFRHRRGVANLGAVTRSSPALLSALAGCLALAAAMGFGRFAYTPLLPPMMQALGLSEATAGLIASANFAGYLAGALTAMAPALARRPRASLLTGLAVSVVTTAAMALVSDPLAFGVLRFLGGVASAFVLVFATATVLDALAAEGAPAMAGMHFAGVGVGIAASAVLIGVLTTSGADWRGLWLACGFASAAMALVAAIWLPRVAPAGPTLWDEAQAERTPVMLRRLSPLLASYGLFGFG